MVVQLEKGDRLIMSAPLPGESTFAIHVLQVLSMEQDAGGVASAIAEIIRRNDQPVKDRRRILITFAPRDIPPALPLS